MRRSDAAGTIARMFAVFAISFLATVLVRRSAPAAAVAPSEWTGVAERAARTREREEALSRDVAALRLESGRLTRQVSRKTEELSARIGQARADAAKTSESKPDPALDSMGDALLRIMVREKMRLAGEEYGLNPVQLGQYEARIQEGMKKDSLRLLNADDHQFDEENLVPLLDREQHAKYREAEKKRAEGKAQNDVNTMAQLLGVGPELAAEVNQILREEGVQDPNLFLRVVGKPEEAAELLPRVAAATDRARARLRPLLSPESFGKLDRKFAADTESLTIFLEEIQKQAKGE